jgi:hypothetical protein
MWEYELMRKTELAFEREKTKRILETKKEIFYVPEHLN